MRKLKRALLSWVLVLSFVVGSQAVAFASETRETTETVLESNTESTENKETEESGNKESAESVESSESEEQSETGETTDTEQTDETEESETKETTDLLEEIVELDNINLSKTSMDLLVGEQETLNVTFDPQNTTVDKSIHWESSNDKIVKVDASGNVVGNDEGTATITAKVGDKVAACQINVKAPSVTYEVHRQTYGWQNPVANGETAGTTGEYKRLEGIYIGLQDIGLEGSVEYRTHVQSYGWLDWVSEGSMSGTEGQAKRLEAIQIRLTGELAEYYDVYYQVHAQTYGWMDWVKNGESAGTEGQYKRLEAIRIKLVRNGNPAPVNTEKPDPEDTSTNVNYQVHVQTYGWQGVVSNGALAGTVGSAKRLEGIKINVNSNLTGEIQYKTHVQTYGWTDWKSNGVMSGTEGEAKRLEAVQIKLTGGLAATYDVYYRVHSQTYGWLGWAKNGQTAGTTGLAKRLEAIEIRLIKKGETPPGPNKNYSISLNFRGAGWYNLGGRTYYYNQNGTKQVGWIRLNGNKYYLNPANDGGKQSQGWAYIGGYKLYFNSDGALVQDVDSIIGRRSAYEIEVNKQTNCVTVYAKDGANGYIIPVKSMICSVGNPTPVGTFYTPAKYRWKSLIGNVWGQYSTRFYGGCLFHSVPYAATDIRSLVVTYFNQLGTTRSAGCIRLQVKDAKWIYDYCPIGTKVSIYYSSDNGPFDRPTAPKLPSWHTWDPTDPAI